MPSSHPAPDDPARGASFAARAGSLLGVSALAAMLASVPAAVRVGPDAGGGWLGAWLALAACSLPATAVAIGLVRGAREGVRALAGDDPLLTAWSVAVWAMTMFLLLAAWGAFLRETTHHHALAGVTFAFGGLAIGALTALVVRRLSSIVRGADAWGRAALIVVTVAALTGALTAIGARLTSGENGAASPEATGLVDVLAFAIAVGAFSRRGLVGAPGVTGGGFPLALGTLLVGGALLARSPALVAAIREHAPLFAPVATLVGSR
jgi:hypothetical protein